MQGDDLLDDATDRVAEAIRQKNLLKSRQVMARKRDILFDDALEEDLLEPLSENRLPYNSFFFILS